MSIERSGDVTSGLLAIEAEVSAGSGSHRPKLSELRERGAGLSQVVSAVWPDLRRGDGPAALELAALLARYNNENAEIILKGWAESLRQQAELDKKAHGRRLKNERPQLEQSRSRELFAAAARRLANHGVVSAATAAEALASAGMSAVAPEPEQLARAGAALRPVVPLTTQAGLLPPAGQRKL